MGHREMQFALVLGLTAHPIGALSSMMVDGTGDLSVGGYLFACAIILPPLLLAAAIATGLRSHRERSRALRWSVWTFAVGEVLLQVAAQVVAIRQANTDAQAGLLFLFLPVYAHGGAVLAALLGAASAAVVAAWSSGR